MPRFQFSMWWLMATITVVCIALFLWVTFGSFIDVMFASILWCILPTPIVITAIYARGDLQSFAIGALVPWLVALGFDTPFVSSYLTAIWLLLMTAICGLLAAATRRWLQWNRWD